MLQQAQGLLILRLIDIVAENAGLNENEDYATLRADVGRYVVEGRSPSKIEFDAFMAKAEELSNTGETEFRAAFEDPAKHIAPAYLKSDVLRSSDAYLAGQQPEAGPAAPGRSVMFDPYALENRRKPAKVDEDDEEAVEAAKNDPVAVRTKQAEREVTAAKTAQQQAYGAAAVPSQPKVEDKEAKAEDDEDTHSEDDSTGAGRSHRRRRMTTASETSEHEEET
jgi:hypothetical protein